MPVLIAFLAVPLIEIALFVTLGAWLGLWLTLGIVLATGVAGVLVIRSQGLQAMAGFRQAVGRRADPLAQVTDGALRLIAGILLILPGFLTDALGLLLLVPPLRRLLVAAVAARMQAGQVRRPSGPDVIDAEFVEIAPDPADTPAGRTRH